MQAYLDIAGALQAEGLLSEVVRSLRLDGVLGFLDFFFFFCMWALNSPTRAGTRAPTGVALGV